MAGSSQCAFRLGLPHLLEKARSQGIAAMAVNRCVHFSALWVEVEALTEAGLVALATTPSHAWVAPAGGRQPIFGTNPIAFGWPRPDGPPFVFDFATSAVARGRSSCTNAPASRSRWAGGWTSRASRPPMPAAALQGAMLTFGGHKGSAPAAMVELLAGPLIGDLTSAESLAYDEGSAFFSLRWRTADRHRSAAHARRLGGGAPGARRDAVRGIVEQGARCPRSDASKRANAAPGTATIPEALHRSCWRCWSERKARADRTAWRNEDDCVGRIAPTALSAIQASRRAQSRASRVLRPSTRRSRPSGLAFFRASGSRLSG
ncbi:Ldh family oxidoreductase [Pseudomonas aeruginosa]|nr:Ldh family oxidoreductase [Pseudomonas aeruginosa]